MCRDRNRQICRGTPIPVIIFLVLAHVSGPTSPRPRTAPHEASPPFRQSPLFHCARDGPFRCTSNAAASRSAGRSLMRRRCAHYRSTRWYPPLAAPKMPAARQRRQPAGPPAHDAAVTIRLRERTGRSIESRPFPLAAPGGISARPYSPSSAVAWRHTLVSVSLVFIRPCSPTMAKTVPAGDAWLHECKLDGYRPQIVKERYQVRLYSRHGTCELAPPRPAP